MRERQEKEAFYLLFNLFFGSSVKWIDISH